MLMSGKSAKLKGRLPMTNKILIIFLTMLICSAGFAEQDSAADPNSMLLIGPGAWITVEPYKGMSTTIYPIPAVAAVSAPFYFFIDTAGCRLFSDSNMTFDALENCALTATMPTEAMILTECTIGI